MKKINVIIFLLIFNGIFSNSINKSFKMLPNKNPPGNLKASEVPMFILIGSDDNYSKNGNSWLLNLIKNKNNKDGSQVKFTFFNPGFAVNKKNAQTFINSYMQGNENANHSLSHKIGNTFSKKMWLSEIMDNDKKLKQWNINNIKGFRSPYLMYNKDLFYVLKENNYLYDSSMEEGFQFEQNSRNQFWPYTLDNNSPGNIFLTSQGKQKSIDNISGLWELPIYALSVPPKNKLLEYGLSTDYRDKLLQKYLKIEKFNYKITGVDLWLDRLTLNSSEMFSILKYNLDEKMNGNRSPFIYVIHSPHYLNPKFQESIEKFINYALTKKEVKFVTYSELITWMKNPKKIK